MKKKTFKEILSYHTGYSVDELEERLGEPLLQPYDCILANKECENQFINSLDLAELTNDVIKEEGFKRVNNSMFRLGNITLQNGLVNDGGDVLDRILSTKRAYKVCVNGKFVEMITTQEQLIDIKQNVGNF